jgi:hypothetical protein
MVAPNLSIHPRPNLAILVKLGVRLVLWGLGYSQCGGIYLLILGSLFCTCDGPLQAQQICARYACYGCKRIPLFLFALKEREKLPKIG